jgi:hypothetical protein
LGVTLDPIKWFEGYNFSIMFKALAILALALFVFPVQAYTQTNKAQQSSKSDKPAPSAAVVVPEHNDRPALQPEAEKHIEADVQVITAPAKDRYDKAPVWINFALAVIGVLGIGAAFVTLRKLERQTAATEKQANHMIAAERAWILAELSLSPGANLIFTNEPKTKEIKTNISVRLHCINDGSSPAWITEKSARLVIVSGELPKIPQLTKEDILDEGMDPLGPGKDAAPFEWNASGNGRHSIQTHTIIYGVVKYRDIFGEGRETWFCYQLIGYQGNRKLIRIFCGPEYSKHT